jgi:cytidyltransferase-like protein
MKIKEKIKILNIDDNTKINKIRSQGSTVLCHGVFDILHEGHLNHFIFAKKFADILIVSVTNDKFVNKGPGKPNFGIASRVNLLKNLDIVDYVIISNSNTSIPIINSIKPNYYCKDIEYRNKKDYNQNINKEIAAVKKNNGKIIYSNERKFSSSKILNKNPSLINNMNKEFFIKLNKNNTKDIIKKIENNKLSGLVIGEVIYDKYIFTEGLGKSGKDSILTHKRIDEKIFYGGALSIALNLSNFLKKCILLTESKDKKIITNKKRNLFIDNIQKKNSKKIIKTKFIDVGTNNKILGIYDFNDQILDKNEKNKFLKKIKNNSKKSDFIIIADYDHGLLTDDIAKEIISLKKPIIVNSQLNAANLSFHNLKKFNGADLLIINSNELKNYFKRKTLEQNLEKLGKLFLNETKFKNLIITIGNQGSIFINKKNVVKCPAFVDGSKDKIGSGDFFLVLASLGFILNFKLEEILYLGSLAAKENLKDFGNKNLINKNKIYKQLQHTII